MKKPKLPKLDCRRFLMCDLCCVTKTWFHFHISTSTRWLYAYASNAPRPWPTPIFPPGWREVAQHFEPEIKIHFEAEESVLFPAARRFAEFTPLIEGLKADHADLRTFFAWAKAGEMSSKELSEFAARLSTHIRKEERELFEGLQKCMDDVQLDALGEQLQQALQAAEKSCIVPNETTRLRGKDSGE